MTARFSLSRAAFTGLAAGAADPAVLRRLADAEHSKNILLLRAVVARATVLGHEGARAAAEGIGLLAALQRSAPAVVRQVAGYPLVGTWATATLLALGRGADALPGRPAALAAAAALLAGADLAVTFPAEAGAAALPGVGRALLPGLRAGEPVTLHGGAAPYLTVGGTRVPLPRRPRTDAGPWQAVRPIGTPPDGTDAHPAAAACQASEGRPAVGARPPGRVRPEPADAVWPALLVDDVDAWRFSEDIAPLDRLTPAALTDWAALITGARALLAGHHGAVARSLAAITKVVVPLSPPARGTRSATSRTAYGGIALSRPADTRSAAVTLAHEVQHAKLAALMDLFDLVRPGTGRTFHAAWRDDPRPAAALLQGAYAHMGVAGFWRVQGRRHPEDDLAHDEFARWRDAAAEAAAELLGSGTLTEAGAVFTRAMLGTLRAWQDEHLPARTAAHGRPSRRPPD
ncbi:HEXXH motif domain-containing protein [Sphaerisporangium melleum]|uniref:HEXXH motif domain-containing protein n=1 Tax=Sphaerisporangium melleum TaxID=321316 RepID=A0A917R7I7_9ACTN|nr:HEXXH motif-containing putative peptide modification protein [Sphaerisporangium melleum]GGK94229.1 HEXXH motif domain-containing protein [Sphaerisporangium melleum]GII73219.1 HEXXH motif domain-containing protein [Sphaerisporangium melleum]